MGDFARRLDEARGRLPLRRMMEERGKAIPEGKRSFKCPYCGKDSGTMFKAQRGNGEMFKCFSVHCPTGTCGKGSASRQTDCCCNSLSCSFRRDRRGVEGGEFSEVANGGSCD
jgi:hypothetical protein